MVTFSFTSSLSVELPSLLKLFITLFITLKVIFKRNLKGTQKIGHLITLDLPVSFQETQFE